MQGVERVFVQLVSSTRLLTVLVLEDRKLARVGRVHNTSGEGGTLRKSASRGAGGAADATGNCAWGYLHPKP